MRIFILLAFGVAVGLAAAAAAAPPMTLTSPSFKSGGAMPKTLTCDGANRSPALVWSGVPANAKSLVLVCNDPDAPAGDWVHWVLYALDPRSKGLGENELPEGASPGRNSWGKNAYGGPCPPPGKPHRYFFRLYALDASLHLKPGTDKAAVEEAMKGHVLAQAELMGTYGR
jgi:Raf kinase inhibitor-like YbhB/YbcL family protein